ncbi:MAG TPA: GNAT family N-acetyltransferase [Chthonomonadales bacterium]|nr:GNAT family N-acetyltransferase [Chthonomonadales bacterium]
MSRTPPTPQLLLRRADLLALPSEALPDGWELREIRPGEEERLAVLLTAAFGDHWDEDVVQRNLTRAADVEAVYVAVRGDRLCATASARRDGRFPQSGYVHWVCVDPNLRGLGLGRAVTVRVLRHFVASGCQDAVLETDDHRLPAIRLYLTMGFVPEMAHESHIERWKAVRREAGLDA